MQFFVEKLPLANHLETTAITNHHELAAALHHVKPACAHFIDETLPSNLAINPVDAAPHDPAALGGFGRKNRVDPMLCRAPVHFISHEARLCAHG